MSTNNTTETVATRPTPGRPSVTDERRGQIIDAYLSMVAERGTVEVTIAEIAERAGVHRSSVRHFVGNRSDLVAAAVREICERHDRSRERRIGKDPAIEEVVDHYFSPAYIWEHAELDDVFGLLLVAAGADEDIASSVTDDYRDSMQEMLDLIGHTDPAAKAAAYQVMCLAEHNVVMQRMGFDVDLSEASRQLAREIIDAARSAAPQVKGLQ